MKIVKSAVLALLAAFLPLIASAHEVYVLSPATVARDIAERSPNPFLAYRGNELEFFFWGFVVFTGFSTVFFVSIFRVFERMFDPGLAALKKYSHVIVRITLGICLIACAYYAALFGPELPLSHVFGSFAPIVRVMLLAIGVASLLGLYMRVAAAVMLALYLMACVSVGFYLFTYLNYLGEILLLLVLGSGAWSVDAFLPGQQQLFRFARTIQPYAFPAMRVLFGASVMFASVYAKFVHSQLALDTVVQYHLTDYFHFEPLFVVLGALIIEFLIGLLIAIGIEIRWTAIFFMFWLVLSLLYFREAVWPHLVLAGLGIAIFCEGYDRYSLEGRYFKKKGREPIF